MKHFFSRQQEKLYFSQQTSVSFLAREAPSALKSCMKKMTSRVYSAQTIPLFNWEIFPCLWRLFEFKSSLVRGAAGERKLVVKKDKVDISVE